MAQELQARAPSLFAGPWGSDEASLDALLPDSPRLHRLLHDLEDIMEVEGFLHLTTDDLARRLRCSKATLYRLAPAREQLFELVIERWLARVRDEAWRRVGEAGTWPERLLAYCGACIDATGKAALPFWRDLRKFDEGDRLLRAHQQRHVAGLEEIISGGIMAGAFRDLHPRLLSEITLMVLPRVVEPDFVASVGLSIPDAVSEWYRILESSIFRRL